jgi:hypothetical protein
MTDDSELPTRRPRVLVVGGSGHISAALIAALSRVAQVQVARPDDDLLSRKFLSLDALPEPCPTDFHFPRERPNFPNGPKPGRRARGFQRGR